MSNKSNYCFSPLTPSPVILSHCCPHPQHSEYFLKTSSRQALELSMESEQSAEISVYCPHCTLVDMTIGPHIVCSTVLALLCTGQSSEDLDSETLTSVKEHIHHLESEIVIRDEHLQMQAMSLQHECDLVMQDLKNHKSIFAPVRRLLSNVLLYIFQMSINAHIKTILWLLSYICHHWRALSRSTSSL
ncbi:hypothetical protein ARMSODRAFT_1025400 [Armillaria solidipes]|uniref:Uncharacterized protein n=1 Tax=Armillaria solidipes TaxID=1076256 RepID=A0A2H3ASX8_9AGAR|nr:hypothetical protein ARMSODRAFT_1025400 [Armillaria solidipes]